MNKASKQIICAYNSAEINKSIAHVSIDRTNLDRVAAKYAFYKFKIPNWRFDGIYPRHEWAFAAFQLLANCFNFAFNVFENPDEKYAVFNPSDSEKPFTGAFALDRKIYEKFGETVPQQENILWYFRSDLASIKTFFNGLNEIPFPDLRREVATDYIIGLLQKYDGNPLNILEEAMVWDDNSKRNVFRAFNNGKGLVELLVSDFPVAYGADKQRFGLDILSFNKRAQLVAVMIHGRALDSKGILPPFIDIDEVGPIADYELPKALRHLGILKYSEELAELVDNWKEIPEGSRMEAEIRAATVAICDQLLREINSIKRDPINICHLDYWLWKMGKDAKHLRPHLTKTSAY